MSSAPKESTADNSSVAFSTTNSTPVVVKVGTVTADPNFVYNLVDKVASNPHLELAEVSSLIPRPLHRGEIEVLILAKALELGGMDFRIKIKQMPIQTRTILELLAGKVHISSETLWVDELKEQGHDLDVSQAVIHHGESEKGLYTTADKIEPFSKLTPSEIKKLKVATVTQWATDIKTLKESGFENLVYAGTYVALLEFPAQGRTDAVLYYFSANKDLRQNFLHPYTQESFTLYPIPNIKVGIPDARAFVLSRKAPNSQIIRTALNRGLEILIANGEVKGVFQKQGIFNNRVRHWTRLSPPRNKKNKN